MSEKQSIPPECEMCGHQQHERFCEADACVHGATDYVPCGCQFVAEGWKLGANRDKARLDAERYAHERANRERVPCFVYCVGNVWYVRTEAEGAPKGTRVAAYIADPEKKPSEESR